MGSFWDKQPTSVCLCVCRCVCVCMQTQLWSLSGMRWEERDERFSVLLGRWQISDSTHTHIKTHIHSYIHTRAKNPRALIHTHAHTQTHTPNKFVWKAKEVSRCHYTAQGCHFSVSHQYITLTKKCAQMCWSTHTHTLTQTDTHFHHTMLTSVQNHCNTNRANAQPVSHTPACVSTKQTAFFSSDEAPTASANEYKHR